MKVRLDTIYHGGRNTNLALLYHVVTSHINSQVASQSEDCDLIALLGLLQSHLVRCYSSIVHDPSMVDWDNSQKALLESLSPIEE